MEPTKGTLINIDLTVNGEIILKVKREDGSFSPLTKEEIERSVVEKGRPIQGQFEFSKSLPVMAIRKNPFQIYQTLPDGRTICLQFSDNFQYMGPCP